MSVESEERLKKLVEKCVNSAELDETSMKSVRSICRKDDRCIAIVVAELLWFLKRKHCIVRLRCVQLADSLFQRSHAFRLLLLKDLEDFLTLTIGHNPASPLPPPLSQQPSLQRAAILAVKSWHEKFGSAHKKLQLAFSALGGTVDFQELCLVSDPARVRRREREDRVARASREKVSRVEHEMQEELQAVQDFLARGKSIVSLVEESGDDGLVACQEEVKGQWRVGMKRLLPKAETWVAILARAAEAPRELARRATETRDSLKSMCERLEGLGVELSEAEVGGNQTGVKKVKKEEVDPTTFRATARKILGKDEDLQLNLEFARDNMVHAQPSSSKDSSDQPEDSKVPRVRLEDLQEPTRMTVDPEKSRFWVSDTREGEVVSTGSVKRVVALETKEDPITWECGAPLPGGKLCKRQDRRVCPFHGPIVRRDGVGNPLEQQSEEGSSSSIVSESSVVKKASQSVQQRKGKKLKGAAKWDETSRSRLKKKVFNRSAVGRVERDQLKYSKIRTKDKFVDQFNY